MNLPWRQCQAVGIHEPHVYPLRNPKYWCEGISQEMTPTVTICEGKIVSWRLVSQTIIQVPNGTYNLKSLLESEYMRQHQLSTPRKKSSLIGILGKIESHLRELKRDIRYLADMKGREIEKEIEK